MESNGDNKIEIADIFRKYGSAFREKYSLPLHYIKVMNLISVCRTSALGGHIEKCDECGYQRNAYNSCRNRHCPKCQYAAKDRWLSDRKSELLPVGYYHIVFTIPDKLNRLVLLNKRLMYGILFKSASETLLSLGRDVKHIGCAIGIIAVLHTWGQNLMEHPHLHCIVTGGGLDRRGEKWIKAKKAKHKEFFIHVNVISKLFKNKFLYYLKKAYKNDELVFAGSIIELGNRKAFWELLNDLYSKKWITYCKRPFGGPESVLEYLGRYTHRVAISNSRIKGLKDGKVTFEWKDYRDNNKKKQMEVTAVEFIRRFMLHILPENFYKIRYYGILSNRNKRRDIAKSSEILRRNDSAEAEKDEVSTTDAENEEYIEQRLPKWRKCPNCKVGIIYYGYYGNRHFLSSIKIRAA